MAGVLSGTSADGIDVALCQFQGQAPPRLGAFATLPFAAGIAQRVRAVLDGQPIALGNLARLDQDLGRAFGQAARRVAQEAGLPMDLVGSHGQTLWHFDGQGSPASLQVGEGNQVAAAAGVPCVCDFRQADLAAGGGGAPLALHADVRLFGHLERPLAVLNLGGMANLSILPADGALEKAWQAFDTGPAGALLDGLARELLQEPMDRDGACAQGGVAQPDWVRAWLRHPFFEQKPPKSTGRDSFGEDFLRHCLGQVPPGARAADVLASGVQVVAKSVAQALERFVSPVPSRLLVAGGGVHNRALMGALATETGLLVHSSADFGVDPDAREGLLFACLAVDFLRALCPDWPGVTGAKLPPIFGKWCFAPGAPKAP